MVSESNHEQEQLYVDSLRWRQEDLQCKLHDTRTEIESLTRTESDLRQQLRAVEQLLAVEAPSVVGKTDSQPDANGDTTAGVSPSKPTLNEIDDALDFSAWGLKARGIYTAAAQAIREAGVPLHYRVIAEEVQKKVPISGVDAGATLIAHLHRAQDIFPRVGRGIYGLQGMVTAVEPSAKGKAASTGRRQKTRRRSR